MRTFRWMMLALLLPLLAGCGYNRIQQADEGDYHMKAKDIDSDDGSPRPAARA